ncbi:MAG: type II toxin-antitoxin system VapC family toxin [Thermodesulfobacteriota bacterium]
MIVLDTHAWVWYVSNPENFSRKAKKAIDDALDQQQIYISSISAWEIAMLASKKRLELALTVEDWIAKSEKLPFFHFIPVDNAIAVKSVGLPQPFHNDPADRIIIATALLLGAAVITKDEKIRNYPHVRTIW